MKKILFFLFGFMATANINAQGYGYRFWTDGLSWTDFVPRNGDTSGASSELYCFFLQEQKLHSCLKSLWNLVQPNLFDNGHKLQEKHPEN
mgnify:CR=1 FL=1